MEIVNALRNNHCYKLPYLSNEWLTQNEKEARLRNQESIKSKQRITHQLNQDSNSEPTDIHQSDNKEMMEVMDPFQIIVNLPIQDNFDQDENKDDSIGIQNDNIGDDLSVPEGYRNH